MPPSFSQPSTSTSSSPPPPAPRPPRKLATATAVLSTLQILLALAVAAVVQLRLRPMGACLLGAGGSSIISGSGPTGGGRSSSACSFAYTVSAASIFASFALSLARCSGVRAGLWLEGSASAALAGWWTVAAAVFSLDASRAAQIG